MPTPIPSPENYPENRRRIDREIRDACLAGGLHIVPQKVVDELTAVVIAECTELRERIANRIVGTCIGRYECGGVAGINDKQLEMLCSVIEYHFEDDQGTIHIAPEVTGV